VDLPRIRSVLTEREFDVWLFYDHHHRDPIAYRILGLPEELPASRRWFYVIPAQGIPRKLVHRVEPQHLDSLPGTKQTYSGWRELADQLRTILAPASSTTLPGPDASANHPNGNGKSSR
jgi:Xaa-Pro dipeptidase